ncbi:MAG: post-transcriptional regulator [Lysinibacillus sp.]
MSVQYPQMFEKILPAIESKMNEFHYHRYDAITAEELWRFCIVKKWRKKNIETLHVYEMVETIFSVTASEIVSFNQVEYLQKDNWFGEVSATELQILLNIKKPILENVLED